LFGGSANIAREKGGGGVKSAERSVTPFVIEGNRGETDCITCVKKKDGGPGKVTVHVELPEDRQKKKGGGKEKGAWGERKGEVRNPPSLKGPKDNVFGLQAREKRVTRKKGTSKRRRNWFEAMVRKGKNCKPAKKMGGFTEQKKRTKMHGTGFDAGTKGNIRTRGLNVRSIRTGGSKEKKCLLFILGLKGGGNRWPRLACGNCKDVGTSHLGLRQRLYLAFATNLQAP